MCGCAARARCSRMRHDSSAARSRCGSFPRARILQRLRRGRRRDRPGRLSKTCRPDGVVRDVAGVLSAGLPVWCQGVAAPPSVAGLTFVGWQEPIGCGGVAVFPNDVIVADADGAVVVPADLLDDVVTAAAEQERLEAWIMKEVERGAALPGLYPPNADTLARYRGAAGHNSPASSTTGSGEKK